MHEKGKRGGGGGGGGVLETKWKTDWYWQERERRGGGGGMGGGGGSRQEGRDGQKQKGRHRDEIGSLYFTPSQPVQLNSYLKDRMRDRERERERERKRGAGNEGRQRQTNTDNLRQAKRGGSSWRVNVLQHAAVWKRNHQKLFDFPLHWTQTDGKKSNEQNKEGYGSWLSQYVCWNEMRKSRLTSLHSVGCPGDGDLLADILRWIKKTTGRNTIMSNHVEINQTALRFSITA